MKYSWGEIYLALEGIWKRTCITAKSLLAPQCAVSEPVAALDRRFPLQTSDFSPVRSAKAPISVVSYNILAPCYTAGRLLRFPWTEAKFLETRFRLTRIVEELAKLNADVVCLQEVEFDVFPVLAEELASLGYTGEYKQKTGDKLDGIATFYKSDRFTLITMKEIEFDKLALEKCKLYGNDSLAQQWDMLQNTVAQALLLETESKDLILVDIQALEVGHLLQELQEIVESHDNPIDLIMCGDFNAVQNTPAHELLAKGTIGEENRKVLAHTPIFKDDAFLSLPRQPGQKDPTAHPFRDLLSHRFKLASAYAEVAGREPEFTDHVADFKETLDYIFYGRLQQASPFEEEGDAQRLVATEVLSVVDAEAVERHVGCPNRQFPSDHMSLRAVFSYV